MRARSYILIVVSLLLNSAAGPGQTRRYDAFEKTIPELQAAMEKGDITSKELVRQYLERIEAFDVDGPALNSMIFVNPRALEEAEALDRERQTKGARGPLHGIPIVLKDNYDTKDMPTTAGSIALAGSIPPDDAYQVRKLREAGAVFVGKTNMHELARGITTISSLGGQTRNPYDPERNPGGSSGGTGAAVAANFAAVGMGSDTCGSIRNPSAQNNLFGLRVTQGLSSRDGIVPLSHTQDVAGPLARCVVDLALVLDATVGFDPADRQTAASEGKIPETYTAFLRTDALDGVRLGLLGSYLTETGPEREATELVREAVKVMEAQGAEAVEVDIEDLESLLEDSGVIGDEFKFDLEKYLSETERAPVRSLSEILERGLYHRALEQSFRRSNQVKDATTEYQKKLAKRTTVQDTLLKVMAENRLDAIVYPTLREKPSRIGEPQSGSTCSLSANSGLPAISLPAGFTDDGLPIGFDLLGRPFSEPELIGMAYGYEQAAKPRRPPARTPSLVSGSLSLDFDVSASGGPMIPAVDSTRSATAKFRLDRPTQTLHYDLQIRDLLDGEYMGANLHRGEAGANGPVIVSLGRTRRGAVAIGNEVREQLLEGNLYLVIYTKAHPQGELRGQLK